MNSKIIMSSSAVLMCIAGLVLSFFPLEILQHLRFDAKTFHLLILQIMGALYFAFAMMNWTAKESLIGGIYGRPIVIGNLTHFVIGALALIKSAAVQPPIPVLWIAVLIYSFFAAAFSFLFFRHPGGK